MEIPVINRMTEQFEATFNSLHNPSLITRLFSIFELGKLSLPHRLWKWGALFLALVYASSSIAYRIKTLFLHYHHKSKSLLATASEPLLSHFDDEFSSSDDDVSISSDDEEDDDIDEEDEDEEDDLTRFDDDDSDFRVKGGFGNFGETPWLKSKFRLRRRRSICDNFSLSDLVSGNGVVKLWENSILGEIPGVAMMSPSVVVSGGPGEDGLFGLGLGLWDLRMGRKGPAVQAQWRSDRRGRAVGIDAGRTGKVYVGDGSEIVVGDVRKMDAALEEDTWWDADGVAVRNESRDEFTE